MRVLDSSTAFILFSPLFPSEPRFFKEHRAEARLTGTSYHASMGVQQISFRRGEVPEPQIEVKRRNIGRRRRSALR
jgi:hypothetical protein